MTVQICNVIVMTRPTQQFSSKHKYNPTLAFNIHSLYSSWHNLKWNYFLSWHCALSVFDKLYIKCKICYIDRASGSFFLLASNAFLRPSTNGILPHAVIVHSLVGRIWKRKVYCSGFMLYVTFIMICQMCKIKGMQISCLVFSSQIKARY